MNLATIALKNLKRNFSFYSLYLMSVSFVLMVYFCFTSFSLNEIIMEKISSDGRVEMMCSVVAVFIMVFVVFYMFYSNNFFMRRRMKELGIYALLGYRNTSRFRRCGSCQTQPAKVSLMACCFCWASIVSFWFRTRRSLPSSSMVS